MNRWGDWSEQASRDLRHAKHALQDEDFEGAAFAAQQAAEKALYQGESEQAIADATAVLTFCLGHLPG